MFDTFISHLDFTPFMSTRCCCVFNPSVTEQFSIAFKNDLRCPLGLETEELTSNILRKYKTALDEVAQNQNLGEMRLLIQPDESAEGLNANGKKESAGVL